MKVVRKVKEAANIGWMSLHASANGVYDKYEVLLETLNLLAEKREAGGGMTKDFAKNWEA